MNEKQGFIKKRVAAWLGVPQAAGNGFVPLGGSAGNGGADVNEKSVLGLSAAWACTRIISETVGTLPLHVYKKTNGVRERADDHPLARIIKTQPNPYTTSNLFWQANVASMLLHGNGISIKLKVGGRFVGLEFIPFSEIVVGKYPNGRRKLSRLVSGRQVEVPEKDIFRITGFSLDGIWGVSAIQYGAAVFGNAISAADSANSMFENGLQPKVYFSTDKTVRQDQREEFRQNLRSVKGAMNAGESPLLEGGMDAKVLGINPKDAQLLESRAFGVEDVCRWFGVDPSLIGHGNSVSNFGTGLEQKMIAFLTFTLRPWLTRIEQSINAYLFDPVDQGTYYVEFNLEGLLRGDSASRADFLTKLTNAAIMTVDEARAKENLPAMGGNAAKLMTNGATQPIDTLGVKE